MQFNVYTCILGATVWAKDMAMVPKSPNQNQCSLMCVLGATVWAKHVAMVPKSPKQKPSSLMCILGAAVWAETLAKAPKSPNQNRHSLKCEIFDRLDFHDFYTIKPFWVGDFEDKI